MELGELAKYCSSDESKMASQSTIDNNTCDTLIESSDLESNITASPFLLTGFNRILLKTELSNDYTDTNSEMSPQIPVLPMQLNFTRNIQNTCKDDVCTSSKCENEDNMSTMSQESEILVPLSALQHPSQAQYNTFPQLMEAAVRGVKQLQAYSNGGVTSTCTIKEAKTFPMSPVSNITKQYSSPTITHMKLSESAHIPETSLQGNHIEHLQSSGGDMVKPCSVDEHCHLDNTISYSEGNKPHVTVLEHNLSTNTCNDKKRRSILSGPRISTSPVAIATSHDDTQERPDSQVTLDASMIADTQCSRSLLPQISTTAPYPSLIPTFGSPNKIYKTAHEQTSSDTIKFKANQSDLPTSPKVTCNVTQCQIKVITDSGTEDTQHGKMDRDSQGSRIRSCDEQIRNYNAGTDTYGKNKTKAGSMEEDKQGTANQTVICDPIQEQVGDPLSLRTTSEENQKNKLLTHSRSVDPCAVSGVGDQHLSQRSGTSSSSRSSGNTDKLSYLQKHDQEMALLVKVEGQIMKAKTAAACHSVESREALAQTLKVIHPLLVKLHKSHAQDMAAITTELKTGKIRRSQKIVFLERGKLLKQRQLKLVAIFQVHKQLTALLKGKNTQLKSPKVRSDIGNKTSTLQNASLPLPRRVTRSSVAGSIIDVDLTTEKQTVNKCVSAEQSNRTLIQLGVELSGSSTSLSQLRSNTCKEAHSKCVIVGDTSTVKGSMVGRIAPRDAVVHSASYETENIIVASSPELNTSPKNTQQGRMKRRGSQDEIMGNNQCDFESTAAKSTKPKRPLFSAPFKITDPVSRPAEKPHTSSKSTILSPRQWRNIPKSPMWSKTIRNMQAKIGKYSPVSDCQVLKMTALNDDVQNSVAGGNIDCCEIKDTRVVNQLAVTGDAVLLTGITSYPIQVSNSTTHLVELKDLSSTAQASAGGNVTTLPVSLSQCTGHPQVQSLPPEINKSIVKSPHVLMLPPRTQLNSATAGNVSVLSQNAPDGKAQTLSAYHESRSRRNVSSLMIRPSQPQWAEKLPPGPSTPSVAQSSPEIPHAVLHQTSSWRTRLPPPPSVITAASSSPGLSTRGHVGQDFGSTCDNYKKINLNYSGVGTTLLQAGRQRNVLPRQRGPQIDENPLGRANKTGQTSQNKNAAPMKPPFPVISHSNISGNKSLYPILKELIDDGRIEPGDNVLSLHTPEKTYFASLLPSGVIQGVGGEKFKTPLSWCVAFTSTLNSNAIKKGMAYSKIMFKGKPLSCFKKTPPQTVGQVTDSTGQESTEIIIIEPEKKPCDPLQTLLNNCNTVNLILDTELFSDPNVFTDSFWDCQVAKDLIVPQELIQCIDAW